MFDGLGFVSILVRFLILLYGYVLLGFGCSCLDVVAVYICLYVWGLWFCVDFVVSASGLLCLVCDCFGVLLVCLT